MQRRKRAKNKRNAVELAPARRVQGWKPWSPSADGETPLFKSRNFPMKRKNQIPHDKQAHISIKAYPEDLVAVWRKVDMRNLGHSKRVSAANNSCGFCKPCSSKRICKEVRRLSERITESLRTLPFSSVSENPVAALPLSVLIRPQALLPIPLSGRYPPYKTSLDMLCFNGNVFQMRNRLVHSVQNRTKS